MPPKAAPAPRPPSPSPPPPAAVPNDANDILIIQDFMDTIDQIPVELTRVHSDLNELGAVLYSTLCNLERKLHQLIDWVQNPKVGPEQRFQLLQEIAEEAARYKLGGDDKIRVAGGACDGIMSHQRHIQELLNESTLLQQGPYSPYTTAITLPPAPVVVNPRRGGRTTNSPFTGREDRGTPTKRTKKNNRVKDVGKDDDDGSSVNGNKEEKKKGPAKRKKNNRAVSPSESVVSNTYGKGAEPVARTARQIAAAAAKARALQKQNEESDDDTGDEEPRRGAKPMAPTAPQDSTALGALGIDLGSREGSAGKGSGAGATVGGIVKEPATGASSKRSTVRHKRPRDEDEEEHEEVEEPEEDDDARPSKRTAGASKKATSAAYAESVDVDTEGGADSGEVDSKVYCTCRQFSYGEMIGCDDDECEIEWYHVACLNLDKAPEGNWICPQCLERRKRNPKAKKPSKSSKRK